MIDDIFKNHENDKKWKSQTMNFLQKNHNEIFVEKQQKKLIYYSNYTLKTINFVIQNDIENSSCSIFVSFSFSPILILVHSRKTSKKQLTHNKTQSFYPETFD